MKLKLFLCAALSLFLLVGCSTSDDNSHSLHPDSTEPSTATETALETESATDPSWGGDPTGNDMLIEPLPADTMVCVYYEGQEYVRIRCAVDSELIHDDAIYTYVGNVTDITPSSNGISAENVPEGTQVYVSDDKSTVRVEFGGLTYYCAVKDEEDIWAKRPSIVYNGKHYVSDMTSTGGEAWSFELNENWVSVGFINSVVYDRFPEFDNETNIADLFGLLIYYNRKEDRLAICVKDDNNSYSDVDWQLYAWDGKE